MQLAKAPRYAAMTCPLPDALEAMGERWSFLIVRAAFNGLAHFEEFQGTLGIARNILSNRLMRLVQHGILARTRSTTDGRKIEYRLTHKGEALMPTLIAMRQWGERFGPGTGGAVLVDSLNREPIPVLRVRAADGRELGVADVEWIDPAYAS
jgi:DNA-binding HxlR family transcriptional regulator